METRITQTELMKEITVTLLRLEWSNHGEVSLGKMLPSQFQQQRSLSNAPRVPCVLCLKHSSPHDCQHLGSESEAVFPYLCVTVTNKPQHLESSCSGSELQARSSSKAVSR